MTHRSVRRCLLAVAPAAALALAIVPAAAYPTAGSATLNGTVTGSPVLSITGAMHGDLEIVDPVSPPSQANIAIDDICTLQGGAPSDTSGTIGGTCSGTVSIQIGGTYTKAGAELVATGAASINSHDSVNVDLACTLDWPFAVCAVQFQG
jgi:hypothetical protein